MKHKHYDLIVAWANGAKIQYKILDSWVDLNSDDVSWHSDVEYRIKPEQIVVKYRLALRKCNDVYYVSSWTKDNYALIEDSQSFIKWLGDEQTIEVD